jgi:hypothetical protein
MISSVAPVNAYTGETSWKMGHGGKGDYSVWHYNITPEYASVKLGQNKITAKISCIASHSNVTKFNSVNVTGT